MENKLEKTGERVIADEYLNSRNEFFIYQCHVATYQFATPYLKNKKLLEFGCGSGYGSSYLSEYCSEITAVDISELAVAYANKNYKKDNLSFKQIANIEKEPMIFEDETFDVVISFQVIEHLNKEDVYLKELNRVLKKDGTIIIATPDKSLRLFSFQKPWNQFHIREYNMKNLSESVSGFFKNIDGYYMSAREDLVDMEISRTKKLRILSLPFTLFFIPEFIRTFVISLLKKITKKPSLTIKKKYDFDVNDIYITKKDDKSINLIIIANK